MMEVSILDATYKGDETCIVRYPRLPYRSATQPTKQVTIHATTYTGTLSRFAGVAVYPTGHGESSASSIDDPIHT